MSVNLKSFLAQQNLIYKNGSLHSGDTSLPKIFAKKKTPFYVYNLDLVETRLNELIEAFTRPIHIHYAMKANGNLSLLQFLKNQDVGLDVVSAGEAKWGMKAGFKPSTIVFSGVGKTVEEIEFALAKKIKVLNVESLPELKRIAQIAKRKKTKASVALRLNPDVEAKTHRHITTGAHYNKFGIEESAIPQALEIIKKNQKYLNLVGLTFHIGSQLLDVKPVSEALRKVKPLFQSLRDQGFALKHLSVGGGLGVPYQPHESPPDVSSYGRTISELTKDLDCDLQLEPGRFLVAESGLLITEVQYVKKTSHNEFLILDTGMNHLMRPALYEAHHEILPLQETSQKEVNYEVVGPICESTDVFARSRKMKEAKTGDRLAILNTGAYGFSMSNDFNLREKAPEYILKNGKLLLK
ncbi:MAG: diaminopimelate decarboxylase [Bdellovibrionales bacterium]